MTTQKEKAKWFDEIYKIYLEEFSQNNSFEEEPLNEVEFNDRLQSVLEENYGDFFQ
jgi:hypothetical protein